MDIFDEYQKLRMVYFTSLESTDGMGANGDYARMHSYNELKAFCAQHPEFELPIYERCRDDDSYGMHTGIATAVRGCEQQ